MDSDRARIALAMGSWASWGGERSSWPVTDLGAAAVEWALNVHNACFGDELLARAIDDRSPHPFVVEQRWPLTSHHAVLELLGRACALTVLPDEASRALSRLNAWGGLNRKISSDLFVLEVAGLAARDTWAVEVESALPSGRRPDLHLRRDGAELWVEISSPGPDRERRKAEAWWDAVVPALHAIAFDRAVEIAGSATSAELGADDLGSFLADVDGSALRTAATGDTGYVCAHGISLTTRRGQPGVRNFDGPPLSGDMWQRLENRLQDKARQTQGASPSWICLQDRSGVFQLTNLAMVDEREQLLQLVHNIAFALQGWPHVAGVLLSTGVRLDAGELDSETLLDQCETGGSRVLRRRLPGGRCRRTFVIELSGADDYSGTGPAAWFEREASWLSWALDEARQPSLDEILR